MSATSSWYNSINTLLIEVIFLRGSYVSTLPPLSVNETTLYGVQIVAGEPDHKKSQTYKLYSTSRTDSQSWIQILQEVIVYFL